MKCSQLNILVLGRIDDPSTRTRGIERQIRGNDPVPLFGDMTRLRVLCMLAFVEGRGPRFQLHDKALEAVRERGLFCLMEAEGLGTNRPQDILEQVVPATFNHQWVAWRKASRRWSRSAWARDSRRRVEKASQVKEARMEPCTTAWRRAAGW